MKGAAQIIVLTPIKNEEWVLDAFLQACSAFADHIILLFQDTYDASRVIAERYPKVRIHENSSDDFNEASRVEQLIRAGRSVEGSARVLLALDADEIPLLTDGAIEQWREIRQLPSGTNIGFKKPDLLPGGKRFLNLAQDWILGYVDDGCAFEAAAIHAQRVPVNSDAQPYQATELPVLHLNLVRPNMNRSKRRMYCAIENVNQLFPLWRRWLTYSETVQHESAADHCDVPVEWHDQMIRWGIQLDAIQDESPVWHDYEVLQYFKRYGEERFYWDPIWDCDWEAVRHRCIEVGWEQVPNRGIEGPSAMCVFTRELAIRGLKLILQLKRRLCH